MYQNITLYSISEYNFYLSIRIDNKNIRKSKKNMKKSKLTKWEAIRKGKAHV
jgi:hypothetical protein